MAAGGALVTASGTGFTPNEPVTLQFYATGVVTPGTSGTALVTTTADSTGAFVATAFQVPALPGCVCNVGAVGQVSQGWTAAKFTVNPSLTVSPFIGAPGQAVTLSGAGYWGRRRACTSTARARPTGC